MTRSKGMIRATNRTATEDKKRASAERRSGRLAEPVICDGCGSLYAGRVWRREHKPTAVLLERAAWRRCPACTQMRGGEYWGRVVLRGAFSAADATAVRRRIDNVAARAEYTQPQRRVLSVERDGAGLEVLTTSQKLAHRIARELRKAFGGRVAYKWSDDGSLFAEWRRAESATRA
ncbi:MAG: NMD3-related protein [Deltaproteobacteria bacterium]|nr:NMD3-related protein [Deltaproteobacteria bacterium]